MVKEARLKPSLAQKKGPAGEILSLPPFNSWLLKR